jgi:hypothetical protein
MQNSESRIGLGIASCPVCKKEASVRYDEGYGYTCACNNRRCRMSVRGSHQPTELMAVLDWNGLVLAIDISRAKGGVDESDMARIFGPIPDDSVLSDESGSESK